MDRRPRILLAQRAPVDAYPPVLHQAEILRALGNVTLLDSGKLPVEWESLTSTEIHRVRVQTGQAGGGAAGGIARLTSAMNFRKVFHSELAKGPDVAIAYEPEAAAMLFERRNSAGVEPLRIVHLHEHPTPDAYARSVLARVSLRRAMSRLGSASAVVVADAHRARELSASVALRAQPLVVMNCPMRLAMIPESRLLALAAERQARGPIVHYHGAVGPDHGLETAIESMRWWRRDAWFFIVGGGSDEYIASIRRIASACGVGDRIVFAGRVPYDTVLSFVAGATVGLSLLDTTKTNWRYAAGASNKRFEYMALGIPQITNAGPGMAELFETTGVALVADATQPRDVAEKVNRYLESPSLREKASAAARKLHLASLNYEAQFNPVLQLIRDGLRARRDARAGPPGR